VLIQFFWGSVGCQADLGEISFQKNAFDAYGLVFLGIPQQENSMPALKDDVMIIVLFEREIAAFDVFEVSCGAHHYLVFIDFRTGCHFSKV
jgi:hypothetical protein